MKAFTDDEMNALLPTAKAYSVVILKQGPNFTDDTAPMAPMSAASGCSTGPSMRPSRS
jgi:hypothetical protein